MSWLKTNKHLTDDLTTITQTSATTTGHHSHLGTWITASASAVALVFSAVSLYHSVLKQPELQFYVSPVVHYGRDPEGNYEVFAIPITVANHGARDGTILSIDMEARAKGGSEDKQFYSAFIVDGSYFVRPARFNIETRTRERVNRPKKPFAPISVAGRDSFSATILFYTKAKTVPKIVFEKGDYELKLSLNTHLDQSLGLLDGLFKTSTDPISFIARLKRFHENSLLTGGTHRMFNVDWSTPVAKTQTNSAPTSGN